MRILFFMLISVASFGQIPLWQLEYAPDSTKVIGAAADGEPIWKSISGSGVDSIFTESDSLYYVIGGDTINVGVVGVGVDSIWFSFGNILYIKNGDVFYVDLPDYITNASRNTNALRISKPSSFFDIPNALVPTGGNPQQVLKKDYFGSYDWYDFQNMDTLKVFRDKYWNGFSVLDSLNCNVIQVVENFNDMNTISHYNICNSTDTSLISQIVSDSLSGVVKGSGTATRVAFWNSDSTLSSDANLYWDDSDKRLGVGTSSPLYPIHASGASAGTTNLIALTNTTTGLTGSIGMGTVGYVFSNGILDPKFTINDDATTNSMSLTNGQIQISGLTSIIGKGGTADLMLKSNTSGSAGYSVKLQGYNGSAWQDVVTLPNKSSGNIDLLLVNNGGNTGIGTTSPSRKLDVNGDTRLRGAIYDSGNSSGSSGQVLTSAGTGAFTWSTPTVADGSETKVTAGTNISVTGVGTIASPYVVTNTFTEVDGDVDNEIQEIQKAGSNDVNIQITGGGGVGIENTLTNVLVPSNGSNGQILTKGSGTNYSWQDEVGDISSVTVSAPIVGGGVSGGVNIAIDTTSTTGVATQYDLTLKQNTLVSGTNIKTVNSNSLLGSGNVSVGTVTSVDVVAGTGNITVSGSPVTSSGTITVNNTDPDQSTTNEKIINIAWRPLTGADSLQVNENGTIYRTIVPDFFTLPSLTAGSALFSNGSTIAQDNTNFFWDDSNNRFGLLTNTPTRTLDANGDVRLRGAIYNSANSSGTSGQVLTSQGTGAFTWTTPSTGITGSGTVNTIPYFSTTTALSSTPFTYGSNIMTIPTNNSIYFPGTATIIDKNNSGGAAGEILSRAATGGGMDWITLPTPSAGAFTVASNGTSGSQVVATDGSALLNFNGGQNMEVTRVNDDFTFNSIVYYAQLSNTALTTGATLDNNNNTVDFSVQNETNSTQVDANVANNDITAVVAGNYEVTYSLSYTLPTPQLRDVTFKVYKGASDLGYNYASYSTHPSATASIFTPVSKTFQIALIAGEKISLRYISSGSASTINIASPVLTLKKLN
jgi:hypothetical protein